MLAVARFFLALAIALILARLAFELAAPMVADSAETLGITTAEAWKLVALGAALFALADWQPRRSHGKGRRRR